MPQRDEPEITIGGQRLTEAQAMTVRVAICNFAMQLENGLGDDEVGKGITRGYQERIAEITELMNGKGENVYEEELAGKIRAHEEKMNYGEANCQTPEMGAGIAGELRRGGPGLRERVAVQLKQTHRALRKAQLLEELALLLAKHPDVARILDLLEETR